MAWTPENGTHIHLTLAELEALKSVVELHLENPILCNILLVIEGAIATRKERDRKRS